MDAALALKRSIAVVLLLVILVAYIIIPGSPLTPEGGDGSITPFDDPGNPDKNYKKCSKFWGALENEAENEFELFTLIGSPTILKDIEEPERTLYLALGVEREYRPGESEVLMDFFKAGGKLVIADDHDLANSFSRQFQVNFFGEKMWDADFVKNVSFPRIRARLNFKEYMLVLDDPTGLWTRPNATNIEIIAQGSNRSYLDLNGDKMVNMGDLPGPIPAIMRYQEEGNPGVIFFVSDPDMFRNEMFEMGGGGNGSQLEGMNNRMFIMDMITETLLPNGGKVIFDESRHEQSKQAKPVYRTIESFTVLTSSPTEMTLFLVGIVLMLAMVVCKARDKQDWIHRFDIGIIKRKPDLPETNREVRDRLKTMVMRKLRGIHNLTLEELRVLTPTQLASMIKDHQINELVLNDQAEFTKGELRTLTKKVSNWSK